MTSLDFPAVQIDFSQETADFNIQKVFEHLSSIVAEVSKTICHDCPAWSPLWKLKLEILCSSAAADDEYSNYQPKNVPHLKCETVEAWNDFHKLKQKALTKNAEDSGAFLVDLHPSTTEHQWRGISDKEHEAPIVWHESTCEPTASGVYRLHTKEQKGFKYSIGDIQSWPLHVSSLDLTKRTFDLFEAQLGAARQRDCVFHGPPYSMNLDANTAVERTALGLFELSPLSDLGGDFLPMTKERYRGTHDSEAFISGPGFGAPFGAHREDFRLDTVNYHVNGAPKLWIAIPKKNASQLEDLLRRIYDIEPKCSQFVRHYYSWPTRRTLEKEGIEYSLVWQQAGQAVITLDSVYHWGFSLGANIGEARNYADNQWAKDGYMGCHRGCGAAGSSFVSVRTMDRPLDGTNVAMDYGAFASKGRHKRKRVPEESRTRVARACEACRKMKEKCQGGQPCNRCTRLGRTCEVSDIPKSPRTRQFDRKGSGFDGFFDVERIRIMEQIIAHFTGATTFDKSRLGQIVAGLRHRCSDGQPSTRDANSSDSAEATSEDEEFTISAVSPTTALYSGELSHSNFSIRVQQKVDSRLHTTFPEHQARRTAKGDSSTATQLRSQPSMIVDATASLPPAEVAYFLLDVFFDYAQTNYSYVDECSLRQKLQNFYMLSPVLGTNDAPWICTVLMMFAVGTQFAHMCSRPDEHDRAEFSTGQKDTHSADDAVALTFYHSASKLIPDVIAAASIDSVQAFLLLGVYALPIDAAGLSCTYFGIAIRIAIQNGMHRRYHKNLEPRQIELRKRIWWTAYTLERRISVLHGRPVSVARSEVDSDLPIDFPELRPTTRVEALPNILAMIKLTDALEDARDKLFSLKKAPRKLRSTVLVSILQLKRELQQYWQSLPDVTFCRDLTPGKPLLRFNIHLALTYHLIHIFIGRSFIFSRTGASSPDAPIEQHLADWIETRKVLVAECVQSAEAVIDLCQVLHDEVGLARASYSEFTSCCAALIAVLAQRISAGSLRLQNAGDKGIKLIKQMSVGIYSANSEKLAVEVLEAALHRLDRSGHEEASESPSRSAYAQFRNWAVLRQSEPREKETSRTWGHTSDFAPVSHSFDVPDFSQLSLPEGTESHANSVCNPFELGELASVPGLDQWLEYGLL